MGAPAWAPLHDARCAATCWGLRSQPPQLVCIEGARGSHTPAGEDIKDGWYVQLVGRDIDIADLTREFSGEPHRTVHIEGNSYLTSLRFDDHNDVRALREEASELIGMLNRALGAVATEFNPV